MSYARLKFIKIWKFFTPYFIDLQVSLYIQVHCIINCGALDLRNYAQLKIKTYQLSFSLYYAKPST